MHILLVSQNQQKTFLILTDWIKDYIKQKDALLNINSNLKNLLFQCLQEDILKSNLVLPK